ncbi:MAG: TIGR04086 family membrane protein [Clostridia bacterium]|nr:TIGR04086 family membrane protein [Clostridia bacterium]
MKILFQHGIIFISSISLLVGGFLIGKNIKTNGIVYGAVYGLIYMLLLYFVSSLLNLNFIINFQTLFMIIGGVLRRYDRRNFRSKFIKNTKNS